MLTRGVIGLHEHNLFIGQVQAAGQKAKFAMSGSNPQQDISMVKHALDSK